LNRSLKSTGLSTLDVYYLNNLAEAQLEQLGKIQFEDKLAKAFETLEQARSEGKIKHYGLSSWQSFRVG
jgi:aryl-alcohol dehydrogenase-like predicted oxidoreductase